MTATTKSDEVSYVEVPEFIELVRTYDVLYNVQCRRYKDIKARHEAWEEIASTVNSTPSECKAKWNRLRNCYTNAIKRHKVNQKLGKSSSAVWKYESEMSFLLPYLDSKDTDFCDEEKTPRKRKRSNDDDSDCIQLISLVQKHEALYNNTCLEYKDMGVKHAAWCQIAEEMNYSVEDCKDKWNRLRNNYLNAMKRQFRKQKLGTKTSPYKYEDEMSFILSYMDVKEFEDQNNISSNDEVDNKPDITSSRINDDSNEGDDFDSIEFINLIQQHELLYNNKCSEYKDFHARHAAWQVIAELMNSTVEDCKAKWNRLRNCYINALKRQMKKRSKRGKSKRVRWKYDSEMSFLLPYMDINIDSNIDENSVMCQSPKSEVYEDLNVDYCDVDDDLNDKQDDDDVTSTFKPRKTEEVMLEVDSPSDINLSDDTDLFFLSMSKSVKKLPRTDQTKIKMALHKMVYDAEMRLSGLDPDTQLNGQFNFEDI